MWSWNDLRITFDSLISWSFLMLWTAANELEFFPECLEGRAATHRRDESPAIRSEKNESIQFYLGMLSFMVLTFSIITRNSKIKLKLVVILIMFAERNSWNHPSRKETHRDRLRIVPVSEGCTRRRSPHQSSKRSRDHTRISTGFLSTRWRFPVSWNSKDFALTSKLTPKTILKA